MNYWHISTKNWDKFPPELIYSHQKALISPVRHKNIIHHITILKQKNQHITKHFVLSTNATNNVDIPAQEVTLEKNEPTAKVKCTDSNNESSNEDDFPSRFSALINYFTGTSSTKHEILEIPDTKNDTNIIDEEKSSENVIATEIEFNVIVNDQQNEKISSFDKSTIHHTNNSNKKYKTTTNT